MGEKGSFVVWFGEVGHPSPSQVRVGERAWARGKRMKVEAPSISDVCSSQQKKSRALNATHPNCLSAEWGKFSSPYCGRHLRIVPKTEDESDKDRWIGLRSFPRSRIPHLPNPLLSPLQNLEHQTIKSSPCSCIADRSQHNACWPCQDVISHQWSVGMGE